MASFVRLYSVAPLAVILPLADSGWDQIGPFLRSMEVRMLISQLLTDVVTGVTDAAIEALVLAVLGLI